MENKKDEEIMETYTFDEEVTTEPEKIEEYEFTKKKKNHSTLILNIVFIVVLLLITLVSIDIVMVQKYQKGPYFAIKVKEYKDGGTKEYLGLGYKVIKYNQKQGRRDTVIGTWGLKYNTSTYDLDVLDLAIEFNEDATKALKKYDSKFIRVSGVLTNVSVNENKITISYNDEDGKYTYDVVCSMASNKDKLNDFITSIRITAIGTVSDFLYGSPENNPTLYLNDCFAEQQ